MTRVGQLLAGLVLLAAPAAIAFFSGGYFDEARLVAAIVAWALVALAALIGRRPLPRRAPGRLALAGLALYAAITGLSILWAPIKGDALADFERLLLYVAVLAAGIAFLSPRLVEPVLALGAAVVVGYGISERLLPGVLHFQHSFSAGGRLEQPLTYWNAMGALAALGVVLCARLAGDGRRPPWLRATASAASIPLGVGLYLSFSRGALAAAAAGLVVLVLALPHRPQLRSIAIVLVCVVLAAVAAGLLSSVRTLHGPLATREREGIAMLAVLAVTCAAAALVQLRAARRELQGLARLDAVQLPRRAPVYVAIAVALVAIAVVAGASHERHAGGSQPAFGATSQRLSSVDSNRYAYWKVALDTFAAHPLIGDGSGSFAVDWLAKRKIPDPARDAHSLYFETASELGLVGLVALALFLTGSVAAAVSARRVDAAAAAGSIAALAVWLVHLGVDWDWEMPAVSLIGLLLIAGLVALVEQLSEARPRRDAEALDPAPDVVASRAGA